MEQAYYSPRKKNPFLMQIKEIIPLRFTDQEIHKHDSKAIERCSLTELFRELSAITTPRKALHIFAHGNEYGDLFIALNKSYGQPINWLLLWKEVLQEPEQSQLQQIPRDRNGNLLISNVHIHACLIGKSRQSMEALKMMLTSSIVVITGVGLNPPNIEVSEGSYVIWRNDDSFSHFVKATDGSFCSGPIAPGKTFKHKFQPGSKDSVNYYSNCGTSVNGRILKASFLLTAPLHVFGVSRLSEKNGKNGICVGFIEYFKYDFRVNSKDPITTKEKLIEELDKQQLCLFETDTPIEKSLWDDWIPERIPRKPKTYNQDYLVKLAFQSCGPITDGNYLFECSYESDPEDPEVPISDDVAAKSFIYEHDALTIEIQIRSPDDRPRKKSKDETSSNEKKEAIEYFFKMIIGIPDFGPASESWPYPIWRRYNFPDIKSFMEAWNFEPLWNRHNNLLEKMRLWRHSYAIRVPVTQSNGTLIHNFWPTPEAAQKYPELKPYTGLCDLRARQELFVQV